MSTSVVDFEALNAMDEFYVADPGTISKEERERADAFTIAFFKARRAEKELMAAQKKAIETAMEYARLAAFYDIHKAQAEIKRKTQKIA